MADQNIKTKKEVAQENDADKGQPSQKEPVKKVTSAPPALARTVWTIIAALGGGGLLFSLFVIFCEPLFAAAAMGAEYWGVLVSLVVILVGIVMATLSRGQGEDATLLMERRATATTYSIMIVVLLVFFIGAYVLWWLATTDVFSAAEKAALAAGANSTAAAAEAAAAVISGANKRPDLVAILMTGLFATLAILFQMANENRRRRNDLEKQYRLEIDQERRRRLGFTHQQIQDFRSDREVQRHKANLRRAYPTGHDVPRCDVARLFAESIDPSSLSEKGTWASQASVWTSINDLLTFYEQLAADVHRQASADQAANSDRQEVLPGSVDEELLKDVLSGAIIAIFKKTLHVIEYHWRADQENYERLRWLINRWQHPLPVEKRDLQHAVDPEAWSAKVWTEYGRGKKIEWGDGDKGPWGADIYPHLAIQGLRDWPANKNTNELADKIKVMWPNSTAEVDKLMINRKDASLS